LLRSYKDTLQKIITDDGNEFTDLFQTTFRKEWGVIELQVVRISKEDLSQTHPESLLLSKLQCGA
jgi:hypothetical protein